MSKRKRYRPDYKHELVLKMGGKSGKSGRLRAITMAGRQGDSSTDGLSLLWIRGARPAAPEAARRRTAPVAARNAPDASLKF